MQQDRKPNAKKENFIETLIWLDENDRNDEIKNK